MDIHALNSLFMLPAHKVALCLDTLYSTSVAAENYTDLDPKLCCSIFVDP